MFVISGEQVWGDEDNKECQKYGDRRRLDFGGGHTVEYIDLML